MESDELCVEDKIESIGPPGKAWGIKYMEGQRARLNK